MIWMGSTLWNYFRFINLYMKSFLYRNYVVLSFQLEKDHEPMCPMQCPKNWRGIISLKQFILEHNIQYLTCKICLHFNEVALPSSSNVARVSRFNLLLKHDSGIPLRETVVNGTRQSVIKTKIIYQRYIWFSEFILEN